ncbi:MAG: flagellar filament capping protein FliD, partial [Planctomycetes bacterium]|nr:flagellar filament capping protein FliD [Planctomycetota bacterium]
MAISGIDGLISGLPTADLIDAMIEGSRGATRVTEQRKVVYEARLEAVRNLNTRLLSARIDASVLKQPYTFQARSASSSSTSVLSAEANSNAIPGTYQLEVVNIAQTHQLATDGQSSETVDLGSGSVILQLGNGSQTTIDLTNASLNDIVTDINNADLGISASVINDGQSSPYRLVLQANESGLDNAITVSGTDDFAILFDQSGSQMTELSEALDASVKFGAGAGAITISNSSNSLTELIPGVTIELMEAGTTTISVGTDTGAAQTAISTFIDSVNNAIEYFRDNASFDSESGEAGILFSEGDLRRSVESLTRSLIDPIDGLSGSNLLSAIGIDIDQNTGLFSVDSTELASALATDPDAVRDMFINRGTSSDNGVQFAAMSADT